MSKSAENVVPPQAIDPVKLEASIARRNHELLNNESWRQATNVGLTALGAGAGLRGLHGLLSVISRNLSKPPAIPAVATMEVPVHGQPVKKRKKTADAEDWKYLATEPFKRLGNLVYDAGSAAVKGTGDAMAGAYATEPQGLPEHWLRTFGMGVGGGLGGYKLVDWLLDKRRKAMVDKDVEDARQEYENLLYGKNASAIDELFATVKQADFGLGDLPGALTGSYLTYALGSPLVTGTMAYNKAKKLRRKNLIDAAQKMRLRQRLESSPIPIFALPADAEKSSSDQAASMEAPKPSSLEGLPGEKTKTTGESSVGSAGNASGVGSTSNFGAREQGLAALLSSLAGAGFGAARKPGGSRARGAVIGGTAGLGGMAGLLGANAFMRSPLAEYLRETGLQAPVILGGTGLGLAAGLRGGRGLADLVGLKGHKNNNPDNDLEELDIATKTPKWLS